MKTTFWDQIRMYGLVGAIALHQQTKQPIETQVLVDMKEEELHKLLLTDKQWTKVFELILKEQPADDAMLAEIFPAVFGKVNSMHDSVADLKVHAPVGSRVWRVTITLHLLSLLKHVQDGWAMEGNTDCHYVPYIRCRFWEQLVVAPSTESLPYERFEFIGKYGLGITLPGLSVRDLVGNIMHQKLTKVSASEFCSYWIDSYLLFPLFRGGQYMKELHDQSITELQKWAARIPVSVTDSTLVDVATTLPYGDTIRKTALATLRRYRGPWQYWFNMLLCTPGDLFFKETYTIDPRILEVRDLLLSKLGQTAECLDHVIRVIDRDPNLCGVVETIVDKRLRRFSFEQQLEMVDYHTGTTSCEEHMKQRLRCFQNHIDQWRSKTLSELMSYKDRFGCIFDPLIMEKVVQTSKEEILSLLKTFPHSVLVLRRVYDLAQQFQTVQDVFLVMHCLYESYHELAKRAARLYDREFYDHYYQKGWNAVLSDLIVDSGGSQVMVIQRLCSCLIIEWELLDKKQKEQSEQEAHFLGKHLLLEVSSPRQVDCIAI